MNEVVVTLRQYWQVGSFFTSVLSISVCARSLRGRSPLFLVVML